MDMSNTASTQCFELLDASNFDEIYELFPDLLIFAHLPVDDPAFQRTFLNILSAPSVTR
jgi:hypothetical protein